MTKHYLEKFEQVKTFMFDVDGVLTDGSVLLIPGGEQVRKMYVRDGYAIQFAVKRGYRIAIITGGSSVETRTRLEKLGVKDVFLGVENKLEVYQNYLKEHQLKPEEIMYMGDDIPDYQVMMNSGLACCPCDADHEIKAIADYISDKAGGSGCVRDVIEKTMRVQNTWFDTQVDDKKFKQYFW